VAISSSALIGALPFIAASIWYAFSPELVGLVKSRVRNTLVSADRLAQGHSDKGRSSAHLSEQYIDDYLEYAIDGGQAIPALILPIVGVLLLMEKGLSAITVISVFVLAVPALVAIWIKLLQSDPITYASRKYPRRRYTLLQFVSLIINTLAAAAAALAILLWPPST
jgi:hypothetical protein